MKYTKLLAALAIATTQFVAVPTMADEMKGGFNNANFGETLPIGSNFYHQVKLKSIIDGNAVISSKEGEIKVPWASLPVDFQRKHAVEAEKMIKNAVPMGEQGGPRVFKLEYSRVQQVIKEGALVQGIIYASNGRTEYKKGLFCIYGIGPNYVDGDVVDGVVWEAGIFRYTSVAGAGKTILAFSTSQDDAKKHMADQAANAGANTP